MTRIHLAPVWAIGTAFLILASPAWAQKDYEKDPLNWDRKIRTHFRRYCYKCHNAEKKKGKINLAKYQDPRMILQGRKTWVLVREVLKAKEMPPEDAREPNKDEREKMIAFIDRTLSKLKCDEIEEPGPPSLRRLNRAEYNNTVSDLFGLVLRPADEFPPDPTGFGFDTMADALRLSPVMVERYYGAAEKILDQAVKSKASWNRILFVRPGGKVSEKDAARRIVERFATRSFRRPVEKSQVDRYLAIYDASRKKGRTFDDSIRPMLLAVLLSPRFLVRVEAPQPKATKPYLVDGYGMAARLSYFLWSGPPDQELLKLAAAGKLNNSDVLENQARRMLRHPRSRQLAENFIGQWLQVRNLNSHRPDTKEFPKYTDSLRRAMMQEVYAFAADIIQKDRSALDLLQSSRTFVNQELAEHYGIKNVRGSKLREIKLDNPRRGGVLTSAALLTLTSDPERTNVPRRGNYIMGTILGMAPPPPPSDVPDLEASKQAGKKQTLREMLELHRKRPECASCHAKIDPLGFGLEPFDAVGRWRVQDAGKPINASGELPDGSKFTGPAEMKEVLLKRKDIFLKHFAENMMIYALGRGLEFYDECVIRDMLKAAHKSDSRFSALVVALVRSYPFRYRRNPEF